MIAQILRYLASILNVTFDAESKRLHPLQQQKTVERRQRRPSIPLTDCPAARDVCGVAEVVDIDYAMICNLRLVQHIEPLGILAPGELAAVHDHATKSGAVP